MPKLYGAALKKAIKAKAKKTPMTKKSSKPGGLVRFSPSRKTYYKNKMVKNLLNTFGETKLLGVQPVTQANPQVIQAGALGYKYISVLGSGVPPTWTGVDHSLGSIEFAKGIDSRNRIGDYLFLKRTNLTFRIECTPGINDPYPTQFRVIVFKSRRAFQPAGTGSNPSLSLFLKENGDPFGHSTGGITSFDLMTQPLNKRGWYIISDKMFHLQPPNTITQAVPVPGQDTFLTVASKYAFSKQWRMNLRHEIRTKYENALNQPTDYDFRYCVAIYAHAHNRQADANKWDITIRGTTSATDN